jgi:hypothetical protein
VARSALVVTFGADVSQMLALGHDGSLTWLAGAVPGAVLCVVLFERYWRCARCGGSVWGGSVWGEGRDGDGVDWPGHAVFGRLLPDRCRACGVRLTARVPADGTPEVVEQMPAEPFAAPDRAGTE